MKILRAADRVASPWKNGGGVTFEIAVGPAGSSLGDFDWRVSTALVAADGAFSHFEDVDRTLLLIAGSGMALRVGDDATTLTTASEPLLFAGDAPATARLLDGPITDLNVMVRRGRWTSAVCRQPLPWTESMTDSGVCLLVALNRTTLRHGGRDLLLETLDAIVLHHGETVQACSADAGAALVRIELAAASDLRAASSVARASQTGAGGST